MEEDPVQLPEPSQRLLAFLGVHDPASHPVLRHYMAGVLWPDSSETAGNSNLRSALWRLGTWRSLLIETTKAGLLLRSTVTVDVQERERSVEELLEAPGEVPDLPVEDLVDDLLPDWSDPWLEPHREWYRQLRVRALETLSARFAEAERYAEALKAALMAVEGAPFRDTAHQAVMRALSAEGNNGDAADHYRQLCDLFQRELGIQPAFRLEDVLT